MNANIPEQVAKIILVKEYRELSSQEKLVLDAWLQEDAYNEQKASGLSDVFHAFIKINRYESIDMETAWRKIRSKSHFEPVRIKKRTSFWIRVAAVLLPLVAIGSLLYLMNNETNRLFERIKAGSPKAILELANGGQIEFSDKNLGSVFNNQGLKIGENKSSTLYCYPIHSSLKEKNTLLVPIAGEYRLVLSDGTKIYANSGTKIRYPDVFAEKERVVELEGEAYFDVAKNLACPFIVKTTQSEIKVTGTKFNISSYPDDGFEQVTLEEGSVEVDRKGKVFELTPGRQYFLDKKSEETALIDVDPILYTSWKDGLFRFQNMDMFNLSKKISRWYDIRFDFKDERSKKLRFSGAFDRKSSLDEFVKIIESTTDVRFKLDGNTVFISQAGH
jgi:hypothetical protein